MIKISTPSKKNVLLLSASIIISLFLSELLLRYFTLFPVSANSNQMIHEELLYVMRSNVPEIDRLGFRNSTPPSDQAIFAIGDSHTYGYNVASDKSWPAKLKKILNRDVYNFGIGGYNVYQYYRLFEISLQYNAKYVIIGLYPANDLDDNACKVLRLEYWKNRLVELGWTNSYCEKMYIEAREPIARTMKEFLKSNVAVVSALNELIFRPLWMNFQSDDDDFISISQGTNELKMLERRVILHSRSTSFDELGVREHFSNSQKLFEKMKIESERSGVKLLVLIIPSKERVIVQWARRNGTTVPVVLKDAFENEDSLIRRYLDFFSRLSVPAADATIGMVDLLAKNLHDGTQTYPLGDGHPLEAGYAEYAKSAAELFMDPQVRK